MTNLGHHKSYCGPQWCPPPIDGECVPRWCAEKWCWVDSASCSGVVTPTQSSYFRHGHDLHYSYETCNSTNLFLSYYIAVTAPKPPPPTPPAAPPSAPPRQYDAEIGLGVTVVVSLLMAAAGMTYFALRMLRSYRLRHKMALRQQASAAIQTTRSMRYVAAFVRASDFLRQVREEPSRLRPPAYLP